MAEFVWRRRDALSETIKYIRRTATQSLNALGADEYRRRMSPGRARSSSLTRIQALGLGQIQRAQDGRPPGSGMLSALLLPSTSPLTPCAGNT